MFQQSDEALLADESFINYCLARNEADSLKWTRILRDNPAESARFEELRAVVITAGRNIHEAEISDRFAELEAKIARFEEMDAAKERVLHRPALRRILAVACSLALIAGAALYFFMQTATHPSFSSQQYSTLPAEKKSLVLPDGSEVILNADSRVTLSSNFGQEDRRVQLDGEAFFEVAHDASRPFIVETPRMDIKVLGTAFNVKAYRTDNSYETSLIRGSIELSLKEENKTITLRPNEKYVVDNRQALKPATVTRRETAHQYSKAGLLPLKISNVDTSVVEVAWTHNTIAFADEPFGEVIKKLERWYGARIILKDDELANTLYTGSFRNEALEDVLAALQFSKPFTYKKQGNVITINK